jgi:hypothetical protein
MLTAYFKHPFTLRKLRFGPAGPYLDDFASHLAEAGYSRDKVRAYLRGTGRLSAWAAQTDWAINHLDAQVLVAFGRYLDSQGRLRGRRGEYSPTFLGARQFVHFLEARGLVAAPAAAIEPALLTEFCHWMRSQRGVTETTLNSYRPALRHLLVALGDHPEQYTAKQLRGFVLGRAGAHKTSQVKTMVTVLRMFLGSLTFGVGKGSGTVGSDHAPWPSGGGGLRSRRALRGRRTACGQSVHVASERGDKPGTTAINVSRLEMLSTAVAPALPPLMHPLPTLRRAWVAADRRRLRRNDW